MVHEAWFGAVYYDAKRPFDGWNATTAIQLQGNDHVVHDVIVFAAGVAINVTHGASLVTGLHCWNDATALGGEGIVVASNSVRIESCYLDYTAMVVHNPVGVTVSDTFFLGMGNLVVRAEQACQPQRP